jgi:WD40 repeat protein
VAAPPKSAPVEEDVEIAEDPVAETDDAPAGDGEYDPDEDANLFRTREELEEAQRDLELEEVGEEGGLTRGLAVKPFLGVVKVTPSNPPAVNKSAPSHGLSLDFVHGYRCHDSRNNLVMNSQGHIVFPAAALVITMDPDTREQTFFTGHDDDVVSLTQHPKNPDIVATGQIATIVNGRSAPPSICIHNTVTREQWKIENAGVRAISALAFSNCGNYLVTSTCDDKLTVTVWDWKAKGGKKIASGPSAAKTSILQIAWNPTAAEFVTVGNQHIAFWTFDATAGRIVNKNAQVGVPKQLYSSVVYTVTGNQTLIGGKDGGVYVFVRGTARKVFHVHEGKINSIAQQGKHFVTGGDDKRVCVLDSQLKPVWQAEFQYEIRSVHSNSYGDLVIGTRGSEIYEIPYEQQQPLGTSVSFDQLPAPLMRGHFDGEVWGLAPHPRLPQYATVGEDNQICVWDSSTKQAVAVGPINKERGRFPKINKASTTSSFPINQMARAIDYSPDGRHIAVGTNEGFLSIHDAQTLAQLYYVDLNPHGKRQVDNQTQNWIETLRYSPTGKSIAVGTHGICICLLNVTAGYKVQKVLTEHTAAILAIDFSVDGAYLRSVSLSYELLYHNIDEGSLKNSSQERSATLVRDVQWATVSVKFDWSVMGIWRKGDGSEEQDYSNINCVDASPSRTLVACGTDEGLVNVFRFPAAKDTPTAKPDNGFRAHKGHSAHVPRIRFDLQEKYLFSAGGGDKCIFQWKVARVSV